MRVAALYDIHGNLPALEAVLRDVRQAAVDQVLVGGDVVCGPMTRETLACLLDLDISVRFIQGNAEIAVLAEMAGAEHKIPFPEPVRQILRWEAQQLSDYPQVLASWPRTLRVDLPDFGAVLFCHGTPRDENEIFLRSTPEPVLLPIFEPLDVSLVVCGHTHMRFDRMIGRIRVVNAGSVGMPFGEPGAYWLLLAPRVELRRTMYDLAQAAERIRETNYPQAQEFAASSILQPPTETAMLELFASVTLK